MAMALRSWKLNFRATPCHSFSRRRCTSSAMARRLRRAAGRAPNNANWLRRFSGKVVAAVGPVLELWQMQATLLLAAIIGLGNLGKFATILTGQPGKSRL